MGFQDLPDDIVAKINLIEDHIHDESKVYPTMADGIVVTATAHDWTDLGEYAEIVPANAIATDFDIDYVSIEDISANGVYELVLYNATTEIARKRFSQNAVQDSIINIPISSPVNAANSQIQAKLASNKEAANTVTISLGYRLHT